MIDYGLSVCFITHTDRFFSVQATCVACVFVFQHIPDVTSPFVPVGLPLGDSNVHILTMSVL